MDDKLINCKVSDDGGLFDELFTKGFKFKTIRFLIVVVEVEGRAVAFKLEDLLNAQTVYNLCHVDVELPLLTFGLECPILQHPR